MSPKAPPDESTASTPPPWLAARDISSPRGTAQDLDRTFSTPRLLDPSNPSVIFDKPLAPRLLTITVTGARRPGTVAIWGRGQVPSDAVSAVFTGTSGTETRTIAVRDADGLWVRATTGGDVRLSLHAVFFKSLSILGSTMGQKGDLRQILRLFDQGRFRPVLDRALPLAQVGDAHRLLEERQALGKLVLTL
jgi:hypothetical protein